MKPNRLTASRPEDYTKTQLTDLIVGGENTGSGRIFWYGQVISSTDSKNANRLRVRIPLLDDVFYTNDQGQITAGVGDDRLPLCIPAHGRNIDTPENGSVVVVALFDPSSPFFGRMWITAVPELSPKDIFDVTRLTEEQTSGAWQNAETAVEVKFNNSPELRGRARIDSKSKQTNYKTGVRGKDKNKLLFDKAKTTLVQNETASDESKLDLTSNADLTAKELNLLSTQSSKRHRPVFADPMFTYCDEVNSVLSQIVNILSTSPGFGNLGAPVAPSSQAPSLVAAFNQLKVKLTQLKRPDDGKSKYIQIN